MPRKRSLDPDIWVNEQFMKVSLLARLLYIGFISYADDDGRFKCSPQYIKATIFPSDSLVIEEILIARGELEKIGLIKIYVNENKEYGYHPNWKKWQQIQYPSKSKLPLPPENLSPSPPLLNESSMSPLIQVKLSKVKLRGVKLSKDLGFTKNVKPIVSENTKRLQNSFYEFLKDFTSLDKPSFPYGQAGKFFRGRLAAGDSEEFLSKIIQFYFFYPSDFAKDNTFAFNIFQKEFNTIAKKAEEMWGEPFDGLLKQGEKEWVGKKSQKLLAKSQKPTSGS